MRVGEAAEGSQQLDGEAQREGCRCILCTPRPPAASTPRSQPSPSPSGCQHFELFRDKLTIFRCNLKTRTCTQMLGALNATWI